MKNQKKGFIVPLLIGIIAVLLIGGGVYIYSTKKVKNNTPVVVNSNLPEQSNQTSTATSSTLLYVDKVNGYQVKLPKDWTNYRVVNGDFQLPTTNKDWYEEDINGNKVYGYGTVFSIDTYSLQNWNKLIDACKKDWGLGCVTDNDALGKNTTTVFVKGISPNSGPNVGGDVQWGNLRREILDANYNSTTYLKANFSVISSASTTSSNLKTYTNTQYGFSFQYPSQWGPISCPTSPSGWKQTENNGVLECAYDSKAIFIDLGNQTTDLNTIIYPNSNWDEFLRSTPVYGILKPVTVNGYNAVGKDGQVGIQNPKGGYIVFNFKIQTTGDTATFNQILSTFKF
ncbi:MAG: hypothetical protein WCP24_03545 [bacterium]